MGKDRQFADERLGDQSPIKRIAVVPLKVASEPGLPPPEGKIGKPLVGDLAQEILTDDELSQLSLDRDLPDGDGADEDFVVFDTGPRRGGQPRMVCEPPKESMGVEKEAYNPSPAKAAARSSGRSSKSSWMTIRPDMVPGRRFAEVNERSGTSLTSGFPALPMMTSSPLTA